MSSPARAHPGIRITAPAGSCVRTRVRHKGRIAHITALLVLLLAAPCYATAASQLIVVSGIGGDPAYSEKFANWSKAMVSAAGKRLKMARDHIVYLAESNEDGADGLSRKSAIADAIENVAAKAEPGDTVFLLLIGHGTARGDRLLFNLPGPDLSATELDAMLAGHDDIRWVVVNGAPSSGPFIKVLSRPNRIVITATANAAERYHTIFNEHFIAAYANPGADSDKNGRVSVLEAFDYATRAVERSYEEHAALQSEHAVLDDPGSFARSSYLESDRTQYSAAIPGEELTRLLADRKRLEDGINGLIAAKSDYDPVVYDDRLETLLVQFALIHRALRPVEAVQ